MKQYLTLLAKIRDEGIWIENERTGVKCKTIINYDFTFDVSNNQFPLVTTRKSYYRVAIGELLGYLRGYTNTSDFHKLGVKTWDANANDPKWLKSPYCSRVPGELGEIYGAVGNNLPHIERSRFRPDSGALWVYPNYKIKWLESIIEKLKKGEDDRGLIWNFWNPSMFHLGCLRPCMYSHHFSLLGDTLYLNSTQRSMDVPLGGNMNIIQSWVLLWLMAKLTDKKPGKVFHKVVNAHVYENQYDLIHEQLSREPTESPTLICNKPITYESVFGLCENEENNLHPRDFSIEGYNPHPPIAYPFTV